MSDFLTGRPWAQAPWELVTADISANALRVVLAIQLHRRPDGGAPFPSQKKLAEMCRVSVPTVERVVRELKEAGILKCALRLRPGGKFPVNCYSISLPPSITDDGTPPSRVMDEVEEGEVDSVPTERTRSVVGGSQALVAGYCDLLTEVGAPAPKRLVGMVAKQVGELVQEGIDPGVIRRALVLMLQRQLHPSTLATLVPEAAAGSSLKTVQRYGRGMTTDQILAKYKVRAV